jgi:CRISPR-associated protein Csd1
MILQALKEYYERKPDLAPFGWEQKEIPFLLVIDSEGNFVRFEDTREGQDRSRRAHSYLVPSLGEKKGGGIKANLFWENIEYMFGIPVPTSSKPNPDPGRVKKQHQAFQERIQSLDGDCQALVALRRFIATDSAKRAQNDPLWQSVYSTNQNILISLQGKGPITDDPEIRKSVRDLVTPRENVGVCLVSGASDEIVRLEPPIKGVYGPDRKAERSLVSVNNEVKNGVNAGQTPAFASYLKAKGNNSPIGRTSSFCYTTALNHLLGRDSEQKMLIGDSTTIFWADKPVDLETQVVDIFGEPQEDDPDRGVRAVESLFLSVKTGAYAVDEQQTRFYVLGLAPNAARIAIRFWIVDTVARMANRIVQHFEDLRIIHGPREEDVLSLFRLLDSTAVLGKSENVPPNLAGDIMRAILEGLPYPHTLLQAAIRRARAEQSAKEKKAGKPIRNVPYARAALIKACINRDTRFKNPHLKEELKMSLDPNNTNIGYRLGRLFATLEKIQAEANPGINATIRDRFYGAASGTPVTVFSNLMRLKNHHLTKLASKGRRISFERLIAEIMDGVRDFPSQLVLADQGRFAVGYYHQTQQFYAKKD